MSTVAYVGDQEFGCTHHVCHGTALSGPVHPSVGAAEAIVVRSTGL